MDVPEPESASDGGERLCKPKVRILQEGEREFVVLADRYESSGRIESVGKEEIGGKIDECVWELLVLFHGLPNLSIRQTSGEQLVQYLA